MRWIFTFALAACVNNDDVPPPHLGAVQPSAAPVGTVVAITGAWFCQLPVDPNADQPTSCDPGAVSFGTAPGTISSWNDTAIMAEVPSSASGDVSLRITIEGRSSNGITFHIE